MRKFGKHIAFVILKRNLMARHDHLMRSLPFRVLSSWCRELDEAAFRWSQDLLGSDRLTPAQLAALRFPQSAGGMGVASLYQQSGIIHLAGGRPPEQGATAILDTQVENLLQRIVPALLSKSLSEVQHNGHRQALRVFRQAVDKINARCLPSSHPILDSIGCTCTSSIPTSELQHNLTMAWAHPGKHAFLMNAAFCSTVRRRLGLAFTRDMIE